MPGPSLPSSHRPPEAETAVHGTRRPIGVFDSGVGGLSVLQAIHRHLPFEPLLYVADSAHAPYGDRSADEITERAFHLTATLRDAGARAVVVACNTATVVAVEALRRAFALPIVALEPAIKPAVAASRRGVVAVLATTRTLQSASVERLCRLHGGQARILLQACPGLVEQVERGDLDGERTMLLLEGYLRPLLEQGADTLVLGCTHYPFLAPAIRRIAGDGVAILDSADAVARQLARRLGMAATTADRRDPAASVRFYTSGDPAQAQALVSRLWGAPVTVRALHDLAPATPGACHIAEADPQGRAALGLLREAAVEARALYPELSSPDAPWPTNGPTPGGGVYLLARSGDRVLASGALRPLEPGLAEVRRMFVTRDQRRQGLARAMLSALEAHAWARGITRLRLETGFRQTAAMALYMSCGYRRIEPWGDYAEDPTSRCFEKTLNFGPGSSARPWNPPRHGADDAGEPLPVRLATHADAPAIHDTHRAAVQAGCSSHYPAEHLAMWFHHRTPEIYRPALDAGEIWLIEREGRVAGFVGARPGELTLLFVHPAESGRGLGRRLLQHGLQRAAMADDEVVVIATLNAESYYAAHGFVTAEPWSFTRGEPPLQFPMVRMVLRTRQGASPPGTHPP